MLYLLGLPVALVAGGYYYYKSNKKKVLNNALDMYASIVVYTKDKLKYIKDTDYCCSYIKMIYYNNDVHHERSLKFDFSSRNGTVIDVEEMLKLNDDIITCEHARLLFSYTFDSNEYLNYIAKNKVLLLRNEAEDVIEFENPYPILSKEICDQFKENKLTTYLNCEGGSVSDSFYVLLSGDLKDIESVKLYNKETEEYEVDIDGNLKSLFTKLKGPFNDWGLLTLNVIRNRWIFDDFGIDRKYKIIVKQGLYLNDEYDLESDLIEIEYNDDFVKLPTLYKLFEKKVKENNLEIKIR